MFSFGGNESPADPEDLPLAIGYEVLRQLTPMILENMGTDKMEGVLLEENDEVARFPMGDYVVNFYKSGRGSMLPGNNRGNRYLKHLDTFSHIGLFSGGSISMEDVNNTPGFKEKVKLVFVSYGSRELSGNKGGGRRGFGGDPKADADALKQAGVNSAFYVSPNTAHEFLSWRRSLYEIAPLLFRD